MEIKQHRDYTADALYIEYNLGTIAYSVEVSDGVIADYDENGNVIGVEVLNLKSVNKIDPGKFLVLAKNKAFPIKKSSPPKGGAPTKKT